jgi:uncharacterized protein
MGLPLDIHPGGSATERGASGPAIGNLASLAAIWNTTMHHVTSFIVHGVFEKYPALRLVLTEYGLTWLAPLVWNLDREYPSLRLESPWVKRAPSEYVHGHVRLSTQPLETVGNGHALIEMLSTIDGIEDLLCFSSDYPHYTMDDFGFASRVIPEAWHRKVFYDNARELFGWEQLPASRDRDILNAAPA